MKIMGIPLTLFIAAALFMISTVLLTEYLKKVLFWVDIRDNWRSLALSWLVGVVIYAILCLLAFFQVSLGSFFLFAAITGLLNAGYRYTRLKDWSRRLLRR